MQFETLDAFSRQLNSTVQSVFSTSGQAHRKIHDMCWLIWQLDWLYSDAALSSPDTRKTLAAYLNSPPYLETLPEKIRFHWLNEIGFSWQSTQKSRLSEHPAHRLMRILELLLPLKENASERLKEFLTSFAGLPEEQWSRVQTWFETPLELRSQKRTPLLHVAETYHWLNSDELVSVLEQSDFGRSLLTTGKLQLIPLPEKLPRPASFALDDDSLWLAWPQKIRPTHLHPIVQASIVCHEAAHLLQHPTSNAALKNEQETMWQSELRAMQEELRMLKVFCSSQPEKMQTIFERSWYAENFEHQRDIFWSDLDHSNALRINSQSETEYQPISLPFLSTVYACLAEKISQPPPVTTRPE